MDVSLNNIQLRGASKEITDVQAININKGNFLKLMLLVNQNQNQQKASTQEANNTELNLMDIINGKDIASKGCLSNMLLDNNEDVELTLTKEDNKKLDTMENFIAMFNLVNFNNQKIVNLFKQQDFSVEGAFIKADDINRIDSNIITENKTSTSKSMAEINKLDIIQNNNNTKFNGKIIEELANSVEKFTQFKEAKSSDDKSYESKLYEKINLSSVIAPNLEAQENTIITITDESTRLSSQVINQVKDKITFMAGKDQVTGDDFKQVTMQLQPNNLGKVNIKMTFKNNKITVEVEALNKETQKILSANIKELARSLEKTTDSSISVVVKDLEFKSQSTIFNHYAQKYDENDENYDEQKRQHKNKYYYEKATDEEEDINFSDLINLTNIKL